MVSNCGAKTHQPNSIGSRLGVQGNVGRLSRRAGTKCTTVSVSGAFHLPGLPLCYGESERVFMGCSFFTRMSRTVHRVHGERFVMNPWESCGFNCLRANSLSNELLSFSSNDLCEHPWKEITADNRKHEERQFWHSWVVGMQLLMCWIASGFQVIRYVRDETVNGEGYRE